MGEKIQITILLGKELLQEVDSLKKELGISRAALFSNSFRLYRLFIDGELNQDNSQDLLQEQLNRIELILKNIEMEESKIKQDIYNEIQNAESVSDIKNFEEIKSEIISLLKKFNALSTTALSKFTQLEEGIIFLLCSQLKRDLIVNLNQKYEWELK